MDDSVAKMDDSVAKVEKILARGQTPEINPDTGLPIGLKAVSKSPKKKCKKCLGRGYIGFIDGDKDKPYPCMCTIEIVLDTPQPQPQPIAVEQINGGVKPAEQV